MLAVVQLTGGAINLAEAVLPRAIYNASSGRQVVALVAMKKQIMVMALIIFMLYGSSGDNILDGGTGADQ